MPKHGFLTPKAIANRIKAKGLQKLRWYCQMCQKQCRDENGFKCHTMSESHQRQLLLFAESPDKYVDHFSQEFLDTFVELLKRRFGSKRIHANQVYQEYISDRNHLHMNSTQWETLTEFVKWLGREGHCVVDETEKGWFISYIDRDPETIRRQEMLVKEERMKMHDEERTAQLIQRQMEKDKERAKSSKETVFTELLKENDEEKVAFTLKTSIKRVNPLISAKNNPLASTSKVASESKKEPKKNDSGKRKLALEEIIEQELRSKAKVSHKDYWLSTGIVVKIISKKLGTDLFKRKAVVKELKDRFTGIIKVLDTGKKIAVDQGDVETVIPAIGRDVLILNGPYRGSKARLVEINIAKFSVTVKITSGPFTGKTFNDIKYEDVSKIHSES